ncbi:unnamed protein product [Urochloa decumbens]|uniref:Uncharacterized protein n=1 Tax=Urochloa decumbens TaxID=240449 RepID=A0ABC9AX38_9POAL
MTGIEAALASGVLKVAGCKLVSLIASEFASITGVKKDLCELQGKHLQISSWLAAIRNRPIESGTPLPWVNELRNVAYDIDDLLYEVHLESEKHKIHKDSGKQPIADCFCAKPKSLLFRCKVAQKIKAIKVKYDKIVKQGSDANSVRKNLQMDQPVRSNWASGELSMLCNVEDSKIPRRNLEKGKIIGRILESNEQEDGYPMIVSILGLGGSGKTTLAKHICHDKEIKEHFKDAIFWVHVSEEFDVKKLIGKLFQSITKQKSDLHAEEHMLSEISNKLRSNKYLLVLDDAWHKERDGWEKFMVLLKSGVPGSKILLTARDRKVAELVKSRHIFELGLLSKAESWTLFLKSSGWVEEDLGFDYIQVGKQIMNRCGGVPLAIKTLGGILCEKKEISIWRVIRDSDLWIDESTKDKVFASLKLSFIHLADELKQCFTFCSIFPKGYEIYKDRLIAQWVSHGFINAMNGVQPEAVGCDYFDSLVKVSFLHDPSMDLQSRQLAWKMHDLIHDLSREILQHEVVTGLPNNMATYSIHRCRYLSLTSTSSTEKVGWGSFDKIRAHYFCGGSNPSFNKLVKKSFSVRSVTLQYTMDAPFPLFILKFEYIGYLEIHNVCSTKPLPEAISGCWNLQALLLMKCSGFVTLPKSIGKLKKLRTLELSDITDLESLPLSIGDCRDLQSLKLRSCQKLTKIPISLGRNGSLRVLRIVNCHDLRQLSPESTGKFSNLQEVNLADCWHFQDLPATLCCPALHTLDLSKTEVTVLPLWITTICTLECLNLECCKELVELPDGIEKLKRLAVLNIKGCTKLKCMPSGIGQLTRLTQLGLFVVACGRDVVRISELENLDMLSGEMEIRNLKYLTDPYDAEKACLKRKNNIRNLELDWSLSLSEADSELATDVEHELVVLSTLEPPSQVENMEIKGYRGPCLPRWLMEQRESSHCEGITSKQTGSCQFLSLTKLTLQQFRNLKHMRGLLKFLSLKFLKLSKMASLEELWTMTSGFETLEEETRAAQLFPVLSELCIQDCPKLSTVKPYFPPSLEKLCLDKSNLKLLSHLLPPSAHDHGSSSSCSLQLAVPQLRQLQLEGMTGSSSGWAFLQHHCELETLCIKHCSHLTRLPTSIRSLASLQRLSVSECSTLDELPKWLGKLCSLRHLDVSWTPMIARLPESIGHLTSLTTLRIFGLYNLKLLPDAIQYLASLESLELIYCEALAKLPERIGRLSALRQLKIQGCPALRCLPQSIQRLTALQILSIAGCPALAWRYKQGAGPDWHLVSHIPLVMVSLVMISPGLIG